MLAPGGWRYGQPVPSRAGLFLMWGSQRSYRRRPLQVSRLCSSLRVYGADFSGGVSPPHLPTAARIPPCRFPFALPSLRRRAAQRTQAYPPLRQRTSSPPIYSNLQAQHIKGRRPHWNPSPTPFPSTTFLTQRLTNIDDSDNA